LFASLVLVVGLWATTAQANTNHPLTGNARYQIGNGLPIPIAFVPVPLGAVKPTPAATVEQTTGVDPKAMKIKAEAMQYGVPGPANKKVIPVFGANPVLFQVMTNLQLSGPKTDATGFLAKSGRSGPTTVEFCAGQVVGPTTNPGCTDPNSGSPIKGLMVYTATANQFGGTGQGNVGGDADVAFIGSPTDEGKPGGTKCNDVNVGCKVIFAYANPAATGAYGAPFGWSNTTAGVAPNPTTGRAYVNATAGGLITNVVTPGPTANSNPGFANPVTEYGGPYTTGEVIISVPQAAGQPELFTISGSDNRVNGVGTISLVAGSMSNRSLSKPNANRGWMNLTIGKAIPGAPAVPPGGLAAIAGLLALAGGYVARQRQAKG
jgi:hypothetical protein